MSNEVVLDFGPKSQSTVCLLFLISLISRARLYARLITQELHFKLRSSSDLIKSAEKAH